MDGQTHSLTPDHLLEKNVLNLKVFATEGMVTFYLIMKRGIQVKYINSLRGQFQNVSFKGIPDILATDINGKEMFIFDSLSKSISILTGEGRLSPEISKLPNSALDDKEVACLKVQENQVFLGTINGDIFRYDLESEEMQAVVQGEAEDINESQSQLLVSDEFLVHKINSNILIYKKDGTLIKSLPCSPATKTISITDENRLICPDGDKIQIFELSTGDHFAELPMAIEADDKIESVVLSKDSNSLFIGLSSGKIINLSKSKEHLPRNYKSA